MIYDRTANFYNAAAADALTRHLSAAFAEYCGEKEVYSGRFFAAMQAGERIDRMIELWQHTELSADMFCVIDGDTTRIYRIVQAQHGLSTDGLPITTLSLRQEASEYVIDDPAGA